METAFSHFGELVRGAIALNPEVFQRFLNLPLGATAAFCVVLLAGFSQTVGQGIILFANRVKPLRFILSLLIGAILFAIGAWFWSASTWLVAEFIMRQPNATIGIIRIVELAYAPQLFSIFIALPYLGVPVSVALSIWSFLSYLTGMRATLGFTISEAFLCGFLGWAVLQILQRTIGRPITNIGHWLSNTVAGVNLVTDLKTIETKMASRIGQRRQRRRHESR
jgi:hypothetical protein